MTGRQSPPPPGGGVGGGTGSWTHSRPGLKRPDALSSPLHDEDYYDCERYQLLRLPVNERISFMIMFNK